MKLSVIIVNFNVKYFIEHCLYSLSLAVESIDAEVWVVDNASTDGSIDYLKPKFQTTNFIVNTVNIGFGKANNQALQKCKGKYVLFLNPDTILPEDCLTKCIAFMEANEQAGALGVRMIDGSGKFLPESKRSFPSPLTSFYKLMGLSRLFPSSKTFSRYSLAYLDQYKNHEVDVLAGAFFFGPRDLFVKLHGFDESFFMYGEDIDLSFRLQKSGYKNYYFSETTIIHFKGESTQKGSLNYVRMFYQAMSVFVMRHYTGTLSRFFAFFIQIAIWFRAAVSGMVRLILKIGMPLLDALTIYASFTLVNYSWIKFVRRGHGFIKQLVDISLPGFTLFFLAAATLAGIYDRRYRASKAVYAAFIAIIVNLAVYSLLPEKYRFSRGVILFGGIAAMLLITFIRWILIKTRFVEDTNEDKRPPQTVIVGSNEEYDQVKKIFRHTGAEDRIIGRIAINGKKMDALGTLDSLEALVKSMQLREIIFCRGELAYKTIIDLIQTLPKHIAIRFYSKRAVSIVGSDSKNSAGEYISSSVNFFINDVYQKRMKRMVDISVAVLLLATFPLHLILIGYKSFFNALQVLAGTKTWVSYGCNHTQLPALAEGILSVTGYPTANPSPLTHDAIAKLNYLYAKDYDWKEDVRIIIRNYRQLGGG